MLHVFAYVYYIIHMKLLFLFIHRVPRTPPGLLNKAYGSTAFVKTIACPPKAHHPIEMNRSACENFGNYGKCNGTCEYENKFKYYLIKRSAKFKTSVEYESNF